MNTCLEKAYELERGGLAFYVDAAAACSNDLARRTLLSLAQEEVGHMMMIDDVSLSIGKGGTWACHTTAMEESTVEHDIKNFFTKAAKTALEASKDSADVLKKAMELERKSYELYTASMDRAASEDEKSFYDKLRQQEEKHYEALENVYYYLTQTGDWFAQDENKAWNWMNL